MGQIQAANLILQMLVPQYVDEALREEHPQEDANWLTDLFVGTVKDEVS